jgi:hypothetical protein
MPVATSAKRQRPDCDHPLFLRQKHGRNARAFEDLPAASIWPDFDDRHGKIAFSSDQGYHVHLNMSEQNNGQLLSTTRDNRPRYTGELLLRTRPKTYRAIVRELAEPNASVNGISRRYRVSNHTVMGIREREAKSITERKKHLVSLLADVATVGAERMSEKIGKASLRDAAIGTGIAVDKMLALTGQAPSLQIANIVMPTPEEREARDASHRRLDEITRLLRDAQTPNE